MKGRHAAACDGSTIREAGERQGTKKRQNEKS
jgi:hypothetical protein